MGSKIVSRIENRLTYSANTLNCRRKGGELQLLFHSSLTTTKSIADA